MIVNPQFFNYRLIIGSLIITIAAVGTFSIYSHKSIKAHQRFLEQEKHLMENELSEMMERYDDLKASNELMSNKLKDTKIIPHNILESFLISNSDKSVLTNLKQQVSDLYVQNKLLSHTMDSLIKSNTNLSKELQSILEQLQKYKSENSKLRNENGKLKAILKNDNDNSLSLKT